jgi:hypothetical protein
MESCAKRVAVEQPSEGALEKFITDLSSVTTVGLDLAKHVFQVHGVVASGRVIVAKSFPRTSWPSSPNCPSGLIAARARRERKMPRYSGT